jgi:ABC-type uncharacterized transport system ATPase subunit
MPIVELDRIRKVYDTKVAVDGLTLRIEPGTMFGLLGPNGSGKSSSIRMMIGMTRPDSGTVNLFGKPFERAALSRIGYLPEERGLYKKMNCLEQLVFFGQLHGLDAVRRPDERTSGASGCRFPTPLERRPKSFQRVCSRRFNSSRRCCMTPNL